MNFVVSVKILAEMFQKTLAKPSWDPFRKCFDDGQTQCQEIERGQKLSFNVSLYKFTKFQYELKQLQLTIGIKTKYIQCATHD